jgi:hypothetical protein
MTIGMSHLTSFDFVRDRAVKARPPRQMTPLPKTYMAGRVGDAANAVLAAASHRLLPWLKLLLFHAA